MVYLIDVPLEGGGSIRIEAEAPDGIVPAARPGEVAANAAETLQATIARLTPVIEALRVRLSGIPAAPDKVCVEFGVKLSAEAGVIIAKGTTEANFAVRLEWGESAS